MLEPLPLRDFGIRPGEWPLESHFDAPETRLLLAVLHDALGVFRRGLHSRDCKDREAFREVERWFRSRDYDWPFSFEGICLALRIDPGHVREGLYQMNLSAGVRRSVAKKRMVAPYRSRHRRSTIATVGEPH
jgi:hypothetical protein